MSKYEGITAKEASGLIAEQVRIAKLAISEAESIADVTGVGFSLDIGGCGMGGYYSPAEKKPEGADDNWESSDEGGWQASSSNC
jgi:hypothetical protein